MSAEVKRRRKVKEEDEGMKGRVAAGARGYG